MSGKSIIFFSILFFFFLPRLSFAVTVSRIETDPTTLYYDDIFTCIFTVDVDESNLACDMVPLSGPQPNKPWDICPKRDGLGHQYTKDGKRYYKCTPSADTGVPGPGQYQIVAWRFYADGAYGDVIAAKQVIVAHKPPPTPTRPPTPTQKPQITTSSATVPTSSYTFPLRFPTTFRPTAPQRQNTNEPFSIGNGTVRNTGSIVSPTISKEGFSLSLPSVSLPKQLNEVSQNVFAQINNILINFFLETSF